MTFSTGKPNPCPLIANMRIMTLNMNGIRSATRKGFFTWFSKSKTDILCMQEIRATVDQVPEEAKPKGYHHFYFPAQRLGYSGVALYCKEKPDKIHYGLTELAGEHWQDMDAQGRYIQADFGHLSVISVYFPSGSSSVARQRAKITFLQHFQPFILKLMQTQSVILCGDLNIAHQNIDLKNWRGNQKNAGFLPEERLWLTHLLKNGLHDILRELYPQRELYSWWSNRGKARLNNVGWRIDYHLCSHAIAKRVQGVSIYRDQLFSDHAPVIADFEMGNDSD